MRGRKGGSGGDGFLEVEIVEDSADVDTPTGQGDPAAPGPGAVVGAAPQDPDQDVPRRRGPGARRGLWAGLAVVVLLVVGANVVEARRFAAEQSAITRLSGVVDSLEEPVSQVWQTRARYPVVVLDHVMVAESTEPTPVLEAVDVRTGERLWSLPTELGPEQYRYCSPWQDWTGGPPDAEPSALVCATQDYRGPGVARPSEVELVDVRSGQVQHRFEVGGQTLTHVRSGEDLVAAWVDDERRVVVVRVRTDGGEVWRSTSEPVDPAADLSSLTAYVDGAELVVELPDWDQDQGYDVVLAVDTATGQVVPAPRDQSERVWEDTVPSASGYVVTIRYTAQGPTTVVADAAGTEVLRTPGWPVPAGVDDGSAPEVLLVSDADGLLTAFDLGDGSEAWATDTGTGHQAVARLRGTVVLIQGTDAAAVDLVSGETLWTVEGVRDAGGVTDGRRVLLGRVGEGDGEGAGLSAHDLGDGRELWRVPLPGVQQLSAVAGVVVVLHDAAIAGYR